MEKENARGADDVQPQSAVSRRQFVRGDADDVQPQSAVSRRQFVRGIGAAAGALGTFGALSAVAGCAPQGSEASERAGQGVAAESAEWSDFSTASSDGLVPDTTTDPTYVPQLTELPTPKIPAPAVTEYDVDVLVVGGGLTGLNAAYAAAQAGKNVVLAEKGTPGYAGLSAWPSCTAFYDPELDADMETWDKSMLLSCDNFANLNWEDVWCEESKGAFERLKEWGWINEYDAGLQTEFFVDGLMWHDDVKGYFREFEDKDRRKVFMNVLEEAGVTVADHTMIIDFIEDDQRCVGAVGLHYQSSTPIKFSAKAVILCTGNGVTKSTGYPVGADTYDGLWMGYTHGLPITGMEFEDFHTTSSYGAGNVFLCNSWAYLENIWPTGGTVDKDNLMKRSGVNARYASFLSGYEKSDNTLQDGQTEGAAASVASQNGNEEDPRKGKWSSPHPKGDVYGGAIGMSVHTAAGVWCGVDDTRGESGIPGLFVAGDGTNGCYVGGPNYGCQRGSTSSFMSVQGYRAGEAAASYTDSVDSAPLPSSSDELIESILAPSTLEKGYNPSWVRDVLHGIMAPGWITIAKNETALSAALTQIKMLQELVSGRMIAESGHDLRLCHEVEHQLVAMELKLRAGLERKESRGNHYRTDYPFHDDNYLYYTTFTKNDAGSEPIVGRVDLPDRWKGDMTADYKTRYPTLGYPEEWAMYGESSS